jgi:hypothetical protein
MVNTNPLFVNPSVDNYQLQSSSPAKDAGAAVTLALDILGGTRPVGAGYDIGAYEYGSLSTAQPTQPATNLQATVN